MQPWLRRIRWHILLILAFSISFNYLFVLQPTWNELEGSLLRSFLLTSQAKKGIVDDALQRCLEGAGGVSSQMMTRLELVRYRQGLISWADLVSYTAPLYKDDLNEMQYAVGAQRVIDGRTLVQAGAVPRTAKVSSDRVQTTMELDCEIGQAICTVYSPIYHDQQLLGTDVVYFDLTSLLERIDAALITADSALLTIGAAERTWLLGDTDVYEQEQFIYSIDRLGVTEYYCQLQISTTALLTPARKARLANLATMVIGFFATAVLAHWFTGHRAAQLFENMRRSRDRYRDRAARDALTGAYSRLRFEQWVAGEANDVCVPAAVVMLDVNDFKSINDSQGHQVGDQVLREVALTLQSAVRECDRVIRYGGDEFLLIICDCPEQTAERILARVNERLEAIEVFDFPLNLSYGVAALGSSDDLAEIVKLADSRMYEMKSEYGWGR